MKYLRKFATAAEISDLPVPNVVLVADTKAVMYNVIPFGVYIQHIDGSLYTPEDWQTNAFGNNLANGVAVSAAEASFVIAKSAPSSSILKWGGTNKALENIKTIGDDYQAQFDYSGQQNTTELVEQLSGYTDSNGVVGAPAAQACSAYIFPNGQNGYLPSAGEWAVAYKNIERVNLALSLIGGGLESAMYWSSTPRDISTAWRCSWGNGKRTAGSRYETVRTYPFAPLNL